MAKTQKNLETAGIHLVPGRWNSLVLICTLVGLNLLCGMNSSAADDLVPLNIKLPPPAFVGTPRDIKAGSDVEPVSDKPRPPLMVPKGVSNLAPSATVTSSDANATPAGLKKLTDGVKDAADENVLLLRKGTQYVQFDLGSPQEIYAIVVWHAHESPKVYHDVIIRVADDAAFTDNIRTLFNNDTDNSSNLGAGTNREYFESFEGKLIEAAGAKARFVRLYSKGSTDSALNEYTEVEIYGRPPK